MLTVVVTFPVSLSGVEREPYEAVLKHLPEERRFSESQP